MSANFEQIYREDYRNFSINRDFDRAYNYEKVKKNPPVAPHIVIQIRQEYRTSANGSNIRELAEKFGLDYKTVRGIVRFIHFPDLEAELFNFRTRPVYKNVSYKLLQ